jgi:hypothetical protein
MKGKIWWCCSADFGEHDSDCKNAKIEDDLGTTIEPYTVAELEELYRLANMACFGGDE